MKQHQSGLWARPNTRDEMILDEVLVERTYGMTPVEPADTVLDIGGNIGASAEFFINRGVRHVVSYEPDPDNCAAFKTNQRRYMELGLVELHEMAVTAEPGDVTLYTNNGPNKACHSLVAKRGYGAITVYGRGLRDVLKGHRPTIVKCDIEGGEYQLPWEILEEAQYRHVRVVVMELHTQKPEWRTQHAPALMALMEVIGFTQVSSVRPQFNSSWPRRVIWERNISDVPAAVEAR